MCFVDDIVIDEVNRVVTTPAYMLAQSISEANTGIISLLRKYWKWRDYLNANYCF